MQGQVLAAFVAIVAVLVVDIATARVEVTDRLFTHSLDSGTPLVTSSHAVHNRPSYRFSGRGKGACLDSTVTKEITAILSDSCKNSKCFTVSTLVRLEKKRFQGTLLSLSSPSGGLFEIVFFKSIQFRIYYTSGGVRQYTHFFHEVRRNRWQHLALVVCPATRVVHVYLDCLRIFEKHLPGMDCVQPSDANTEQFCVGQRVTGELPFLGSVQNLTFYEGTDEIARMCPSFDSAAMWKQRYESLKAKVDSMMGGMLQELQICQNKIEGSLQCFVNGTSYTNGSRLSQRCLQCMCVHGKLTCEEPVCPSVKCKAGERIRPADYDSDQCCPQCEPDPSSCMLEGKHYEHGATMYRSNDYYHCFPCRCINGSVECGRSVAGLCPTLRCKENMQYRSKGTCCKSCLSVDYCNKIDCGVRLGTCKNIPGDYRCVCHPFAELVNRRCVPRRRG